MQSTPSIEFSQFIGAIKTHNELFPDEMKALDQSSSVTRFHVKLFGAIVTECDFFEDAKKWKLTFGRNGFADFSHQELVEQNFFCKK